MDFCGRERLGQCCFWQNETAEPKPFSTNAAEKLRYQSMSGAGKGEMPLASRAWHGVGRRVHLQICHDRCDLAGRHIDALTFHLGGQFQTMGPDQDIASAPGVPVDEFRADRPGAIQQMLINEGDALLVAQVCGCCKHAANGLIDSRLSAKAFSDAAG